MTYSNPAAYERFMGRWSARLAPAFIDFVAFHDARRVLDIGCGTGALTAALLAASVEVHVVGVDSVAEYASFARRAVPGPRAEFRVAAAETLPFAEQAFDAALSLLVLQDLADPARAVREMARVTRRGGVVATCQWDFQNGIPMLALLRQAAAAVAPEVMARRAAEVPINRTSLQDLAELWTGCGLLGVRTSTLELSMKFASFDDYWLPLVGGATPTSAFMSGLDRDTGGALARVLRGKVPAAAADGSFVLPARAWAVAGISGR